MRLLLRHFDARSIQLWELGQLEAKTRARIEAQQRIVQSSDGTSTGKNAAQY